jgi:cytidine deaminase
MDTQWSLPNKIFNSANDLPEQYKTVLTKAIEGCASAYAPYSNFLVAAAGLLSNGDIIVGTNQENASSPNGICAERTLLSAISTLPTTTTLQLMAVSYKNLNHPQKNNVPITPCGVCRQSLLEYSLRFNTKVPLLLSGQTGPIWYIENANDLLPLAFTNDWLK